jgi:uncharacterized protein YfaS (alpha-2-macroglobulin family)
MKKILLIVFSAILSLSTVAQSKTNMNFANVWNDVKQLEKSGKPKSALSKLDEIEKEAQRENNRQQQLKVLIYRPGLQGLIRENTLDEAISGYKQFEASSSDPVEIAIVHSLIAGEFSNYYNQNRYRINQHTPLQGYIPENTDEWSKNIFQDTIIALLNKSLAPAGLLQSTESTVYSDLLELGKDSRTQRPTVFDLLSYRAIELWPLQPETITDKTMFSLYPDFIKLSSFPDKKLEIFRNLIVFHTEDKQPDALIMADLSRLTYLQQNSTGTDSMILLNTDNLLKRFSESPVSVEVIAIKAQTMLRNKQINYKEEDFDQSIPQKVYDLLQAGIKKFPNYARINILKNMLQELEQKTVQINGKGVFHSNEPIKIKLHYTNLTNPVITIWRYDMDPVAYLQANTKERNNSRKKEISRKLTLAPTNYYITKDTLIEFTALPYGIYELTVEDKNMREHSSEFRVTDVFTLIRDNSNNLSKEVIIVDNTSGKPLSGVTTEIYEETYRNGRKLNRLSTGETDNNGKIAVTGKRNASSLLFVKNGKDQYAPNPYFYYGNESKEKGEKQPKYVVFTDRAIYRPGQTVHFKAIAYYLENNLNKIIPDNQLIISLRDANYKEINTQTLKTNEFGSVASSFVIPENVKSGNFTIIINNNTSSGFSVEEYKRPTFEVTIDKPAGTYSFGDEVQITGNVKSYMGMIIPDAKITYRIISKPNFFWRTGIPFRQEKQVANGEIKSDESGKFTFSFIPEKDKQNCLKEDYYRYSIIVEVTDTNGESQTTESSIHVGDRSMRLSMNLPEKIADSFDSLLIEARTLNGEPVKTSVFYTVYALEDIIKLTEDRTDISKLKREKEATSGSIESNQPFSLKDISAGWDPGYYRFVFQAKDDKGRTVTDSIQTILFKKGSINPPVRTHLWTEVDTQQIRYGENADFRIGTSDQSVWLYYEIHSKNGIIKYEWNQLSNEIRSFSIPFEEKNGEMMNVEFFFVKDGKFYRNNIVFEKKQEKRNLALEFSTFRDKLQPGEKEEWTIKIPGLNGSAELLATLYDASLDKFRKNNWVFNTTYNEYFYFSRWDNRTQQEFNLYSSSHINRYKYHGLLYDKFITEDHARYPYPIQESMVLSEAVMAQDAEDAVFDSANGFRPAVSLKMRSKEEKAATTDLTVASEEEGIDMETVNMRSNFAETAFFYPQLKTNDKGEVLISFTIPESLTRWRFMGLAHTVDLFSGQIEKEVVTQKNFMIMPNLPRFLRQGDQCTITANIVNNSEAQLKGKATIELLDPVTEKMLLTRTVDFNLNPGKSQVVSWSVKIPQDKDIVICRIAGISGKISDGEQKLLPVLSDKIMVTESMPMTIRSNQTRIFTFDKLKNNNSNTLQSKLLKLEFTASPVWYAVQALPSVSVPDSENAISVMAAYYSSTLSQFIARSHPKIKATIDAWKATGGTKETLLSKLEKNTELKNILLEETPWVLEAKEEGEQKQRLGTLFDLNNQEANRTAMMAKILAMQRPDGSFSWFPQMSGSRYITTYILNKMIRLVQLDAVQYGDSEKRMQIRALNYLDQELQKDYEQLKKSSGNLKNAKISSLQLYYHMMRSGYRDIPIYGGTLDANKFYYGLIKEQWTEFGLYEKAMAALTLYRNGDTQLAKQIVNSLREYSSVTNEMGMYWANNRAGYFWNESAITTHTTLMEALVTIDPKTEETDEMRIWLLKQKQTQRWESVPATVDAIYAILLKGSDWLSGNNDISIRMGGKTVQPETPETGTGYFTKVFTGQEIKPELSTVQIKKDGAGIGWGALYWQYEEKLDKIEKARTGLHIEKKLMLEQVTSKGTGLIPVTEKTKLKTGDKIIVRFVIRTDRDMEYVVLKDQRASCLEPVNQLSGYRYGERIGYYQSPKDASMQYFFDFLPEGTYVLEYPLWVTHAGEYTNGITTLQCLYAPEFVSHTESIQLNVK